MIFASAITGNGYMAQFNNIEYDIIESALSLYNAANESNMASDRLPEKEEKLVCWLDELFRRDFARCKTIYTSAEIIAIYNALNFWNDAIIDFPEYWNLKPVSAKKALPICRDMTRKIKSAATANALTFYK